MPELLPSMEAVPGQGIITIVHRYFYILGEGLAFGTVVKTSLGTSIFHISVQVPVPLPIPKSC